ncbi:hypothetical protein F6Y24_04655 [Xanthomonas arboricola pv. pruni]|nr:hypothetical protein F6Y24_04655 [Xanthomonas arboricola pv. pruni]
MRTNDSGVGLPCRLRDEPLAGHPGTDGGGRCEFVGDVRRERRNAQETQNSRRSIAGGAGARNWGGKRESGIGNRESGIGNRESLAPWASTSPRRISYRDALYRIPIPDSLLTAPAPTSSRYRY